MKNSIRTTASLFTAALFLSAPPTHALTNDDIAGSYQGTSVATTANGTSVTAQVGFTIKRSGKIKGVATVNGQTVHSKGRYQFVSEYGIAESTDGGEALGFVEQNGSTLTFNLLVRLDNGQVIKEITTVNKQ